MKPDEAMKLRAKMLRPMTDMQLRKVFLLSKTDGTKNAVLLEITRRASLN